MAITESAAPAAPRISVTTALFNPSYYLAGVQALALGLAVILLTALIGSFGNTHVNGVIDVNIGRSASLWVFFTEGLINWLSVAVLLYAAARLLSRSRHLRAVDIFGTQALARAPMLLAMFASLLPGFQRVAASLHTTEARPALTSIGDNPEFAIWIAVLVFAVLMIVWMVALMYRAYVSAANLRGPGAVASFIVALVAGEIVSKFAIAAVLGRVV
jgi:hypothetical protein